MVPPVPVHSPEISLENRAVLTSPGPSRPPGPFQPHQGRFNLSLGLSRPHQSRPDLTRLFQFHCGRLDLTGAISTSPGPFQPHRGCPNLSGISTSPGPFQPHRGRPDLTGAIPAQDAISTLPGPFQPHQCRLDLTRAIPTSLGQSRPHRGSIGLTGAVPTSLGPSQPHRGNTKFGTLSPAGRLSTRQNLQAFLVTKHSACLLGLRPPPSAQTARLPSPSVPRKTGPKSRFQPDPTGHSPWEGTRCRAHGWQVLLRQCKPLSIEIDWARACGRQNEAKMSRSSSAICKLATILQAGLASTRCHPGPVCGPGRLGLGGTIASPKPHPQPGPPVCRLSPAASWDPMVIPEQAVAESGPRAGKFPTGSTQQGLPLVSAVIQ
ncbi:hypothetical protein MDA_GLEAN10007376 [Myotis davidii]|uniref:Uncharacterized protein n=1 Tax=Myotis davidii TaxID=225400 RepID=L5LX87_MYODS|nr:hypothetical protein MDA_GLEAN10007376 [Myotis davidii]